MTRYGRAESQTKMHHVVLKGNNDGDIFFDNEDYEKFLWVLSDVKQIYKYKVFAYCLMTNHVHLLVQDGEEHISELMHRIELRYVRWYNQKYDFRGHLFRNRFFSKPVNDTAYFLAVLQYIYNNPVAGGICSSPLSYPWSSCSQLMVEKLNLPPIVEPLQNFPVYPDMLQLLDCDIYVSEKECGRLEDSEIKIFAMKKLGLKDWKELKLVSQEEVVELAKALLSLGVSKRRIERVLGLSVYKIKKLLG